MSRFDPAAQKNKRIHRLLIASFLEGMLTFVILLVIPGESGSGALWGYSDSRLLMIAGVLFISTVFAACWVWLRRHSRYGQKLTQWLNHISKTVWWLLLTFFSTLFLLLSFLSLQWLFVATDDFLRAYLERLTPFLVYAQLLCVQAIVFIQAQFKDEKAGWKFWIFLLGVLLLLPWLLVVEYFFADGAFPAYYVAERYASAYTILLPLALFMTALYGQFLIFVLRQILHKKIPVGWVVAVLFVIFGYFYYNAAMHHAEILNDDPTHSDQSAYMEFSRRAYETDFSFTGTRNQMPLYPYLQALFYQPDMGEAAFFEQGKQVNIILSLVLLVILFFVFQKFLSLHRAVVLTLINAVSLFIFKSGYFTSELLYYSLSFLGFLGMGLMLVTPSWLIGVITGIVLALAYLTKASILPAMVAFGFAFFVKEILTYFRGKQETNQQIGRKERVTRLASFSLVFIIFLAVLSPYLLESRQKYGHYFYNVNSTFYIWYDTWGEAVRDTARYGYREQWPDLPPEEIPGFRKYVRTHSFREMKTRLLTGLEKQIIYLRKPYSAVNYMRVYVLALFLLAPWAGLKQLGKMIGENLPLLLFSLLNLVGYLLLFAWYFPIAGGPRFLYGLFLPVAFFLFVVTNKLTKSITLAKLKVHLDWISLVDFVVLAILLVDFTKTAKNAPTCGRG